MSGPLLLLLVFAAVSALGYAVVSTIGESVEEKAAGAGENSFPYAAFTTPRDLARKRLFAGYGAFLALFAVLSASGLGPAPAGAVALAAAFAAGFLPLALVRKRLRKRLEAAESQVLDLATGLASGLRSGQALPAALEAVSARLPSPMSDEVKTVLREYRLGLDLPDALARLSARVPCEDLTLLVGSIRLTQQAGGSLAEVLDKMVEMIRGRTEFQAKLKTMTAQGRFEAIAMSLAPAFVFVLLFLIDRPLMLPLVTTPMGWTTIVADAAWLTIGFFIIKRIVTIEV